MLLSTRKGETNMKDLGRKIRNLRTNAGYTQDDLGQALSVTRQAISNWERNRTEPDIDTIIQICEVFSIPLSHFQDEKNEKVVLESSNDIISEKKVNENKIIKYIFSFSPIVLFVLLLPFMQQEVPYHTDLMGNIDRIGSRLIVFGVMSVYSALLFYLYCNLSEKRVLFSLVLITSMCIITLFLLASVVQMENIFKGFTHYISGSYGNQMSFIICVMTMLLFMTIDIIPQNLVFGIRNSVTLRSKKAWEYVHIKAKPVILCCSIVNLYIFLLPASGNFMKMLISFISIVLAVVAVTVISQMYKRQTSR